MGIKVVSHPPKLPVITLRVVRGDAQERRARRGVCDIKKVQEQIFENKTECAILRFSREERELLCLPAQRLNGARSVFSWRGNSDDWLERTVGPGMHLAISEGSNVPLLSMVANRFSRAHLGCRAYSKFAPKWRDVGGPVQARANPEHGSGGRGDGRE